MLAALKLATGTPMKTDGFDNDEFGDDSDDARVWRRSRKVSRYRTYESEYSCGWEPIDFYVHRSTRNARAPSRRRVKFKLRDFAIALFTRCAILGGVDVG